MGANDIIVEVHGIASIGHVCQLTAAIVVGICKWSATGNSRTAGAPASLGPRGSWKLPAAIDVYWLFLNKVLNHA